MAPTAALTAQPIPNRFPVRETADLLAELCRRQDEGEPVTEMFLAVFKAVATDHARSVDAARTLATFLDGRAALSKQARDYWTARAKADEAALDELKDVCRASMEEHPDLPWRDSQKQKLSLCNNSQPSLVTEIQTETKHVSGVLSEQDRSWLPERYVKLVSYFALDTEALKADLASGAAQVGWARLERGKHVRGLVMKAAKEGIE